MVIFANNIVTLYNRYFDDEEEQEIWYPTLLTNVNLVTTKGANITKTGIEDADAAKLFLDSDSTHKDYVGPKAWTKLEDKEDSYTLTEGVDFFVEGNTTGVIPTDEKFFEYMQQNYDRVYRITSVDIYDDIMQHTEVGGK